jgi:hypothetical protein
LLDSQPPSAISTSGGVTRSRAFSGSPIARFTTTATTAPAISTHVSTSFPS